MHNIILIGMPGCGKTAIGEALASAISYKFIDCDHVIEQKFGSIEELFGHGEPYFREQESKALDLIIIENDDQPVVLATGGGIILKQENVKKLKEFGKIIYIYREINDIIESISGNGRPWLEGSYREQLQQRYNQRKELYENAASFKVENNQTIQSCLKTIMDWIGETNDHISS